MQCSPRSDGLVRFDPMHSTRPSSHGQHNSSAVSSTASKGITLQLEYLALKIHAYSTCPKFKIGCKLGN